MAVLEFPRIKASLRKYVVLVSRFPLQPLDSRAAYNGAMAMLDTLLPRAEAGRLDAGEKNYMKVLLGLVRTYEESRSTVLAETKELGPVEMLKFLMEGKKMNTVDLGKLIGGSGQASMVLHGKRELSKKNIRTLAEYFGVSPALFL